MADTHTDTIDHSELEKQAEYARKKAAQGFDFGLAVGTAFVESMRNTYYRHTGTALDELIDNSIEAGAGALHIALGYYGNSESKPDGIATIDNGHGMVPEMIPFSVLWGGTHREDSRAGLGRFGFGLPSASVNQGRRYTVFSKTSKNDWHGVIIDLDDIRDGKYNDQHGRVVAPQASRMEPPDWVMKYIEDKFPGKALNQGTIVLWEKLDRLDWITTTGLNKNLLQHFGVTFRAYLKNVDLFFDGNRVEPTDPLFITPGYRYYDIDEDLAEARPSTTIEIGSKTTGRKVAITVRYAAFPPTFLAIDKTKDARRGNQNERFPVVKANAGIVITRMGRQIDVIEHTPWANFERFRNDDRYWAAEIDFPAELDEEFTISNSKQGVVIKDRVWNILKENGVRAALEQLRTDYETARKDRARRGESEEEKRPSEKAMEESEKFRPQRSKTTSPERERKARDALEQYAKQRAKETNRPEKEVLREVEKEAAEHPFRVEFEQLPGAPFFRVKQIGGMKVLFINQLHPFYSDIYAAPDSARRVRAALEVLLFSIGECELDAAANPDRSHFYTVERQEWSLRLASALEILDRYVFKTEIGDQGDGVDGPDDQPNAQNDVGAAAE